MIISDTGSNRRRLIRTAPRNGDVVPVASHLTLPSADGLTDPVEVAESWRSMGVLLGVLHVELSDIKLFRVGVAVAGVDRDKAGAALLSP